MTGAPARKPAIHEITTARRDMRSGYSLDRRPECGQRHRGECHELLTSCGSAEPRAYGFRERYAATVTSS